MVGGYKVIDLKNISISANPVKIPGTYHRIESSPGKPILLRGINVGGNERHSAYCQVSVNGGEFFLIYSVGIGGSIFFVRVDQDDLVRHYIYIPSSPQGDPPVSGEDGPSASM